MPFVFGDDDLASVAVGLAVAVGSGDACYALVEAFVGEHEVKRCDVAWHGDVAVVGIDGRERPGVLRGGGDGRVGRAGEEEEESEE